MYPGRQALMIKATACLSQTGMYVPEYMVSPSGRQWSLQLLASEPQIYHTYDLSSLLAYLEISTHFQLIYSPRNHHMTVTPFCVTCWMLKQLYLFFLLHNRDVTCQLLKGGGGLPAKLVTPKCKKVSYNNMEGILLTKDTMYLRPLSQQSHLCCQPSGPNRIQSSKTMQ